MTQITAEIEPTPTCDDLPQRYADFDTLGQALDYAACGKKGFNFFDAKARLEQAYTFKELREDAVRHAYRFIRAGVKPQDRIALIAETDADFCAYFFGAVYAGALPVPLPLSTSFGGKEAYASQLAVQLDSSAPVMLIGPDAMKPLFSLAGERKNIDSYGWDELKSWDDKVVALPQAETDDLAYLQYSSGSTRFPHGVEITHKALLHNLGSHSYGMQMTGQDRCISWLPFYHDMGLVGCMLSMVGNQIATDYLKTSDFARRPLIWLDLISRNKESSASFSPTFGYEICARRISSKIDVAERFDLSRWRIAGNGADMIRPDVMQSFKTAFAPAGFDSRAFLPSYGLAEATLAVTLMPPGEGLSVELVRETHLSGGKQEEGGPVRYRSIVNCGKPVRDTAIEVRDENGAVLPEHEIGKIWMKSPAVMTGYFRDEEATSEALVDGWLDTGDMGYFSNDYLYIVGRIKDLIIINGKNHWPQDIEWAVEQLPGFKSGDIAAFSIARPGGEEVPAVLVQCRTSDKQARKDLLGAIKEKVNSITGTSCVVEFVPPRSLPRTSSGKLSRSKARNLYLNGEFEPIAVNA